MRQWEQYLSGNLVTVVGVPIKEGGHDISKVEYCSSHSTSHLISLDVFSRWKPQKDKTATASERQRQEQAAPVFSCEWQQQHHVAPLPLRSTVLCDSLVLCYSHKGFLELYSIV